MLLNGRVVGNKSRVPADGRLELTDDARRPCIQHSLSVNVEKGRFITGRFRMCNRKQQKVVL